MLVRALRFPPHRDRDRDRVRYEGTTVVRRLFRQLLGSFDDSFPAVSTTVCRRFLGVGVVANCVIDPDWRVVEHLGMLWDCHPVPSWDPLPSGLVMQPTGLDGLDPIPSQRPLSPGPNKGGQLLVVVHHRPLVAAGVFLKRNDRQEVARLGSDFHRGTALGEPPDELVSKIRGPLRIRCPNSRRGLWLRLLGLLCCRSFIHVGMKKTPRGIPGW